MAGFGVAMFAAEQNVAILMGGGQLRIQHRPYVISEETFYAGAIANSFTVGLSLPTVVYAIVMVVLGVI